MENTIVIDDGARVYRFENKIGEIFSEFTFNPADTGIIDRYKSVVEFIDNYNIGDTDDNIEALKQLENEIVKQFNTLLNKDVSGSMFKTYSPCTLFPTGDFFCEVILEFLADQIEKELNTRIEKKAAKIKKATAKYTK